MKSHRIADPITKRTLSTSMGGTSMNAILAATKSEAQLSDAQIIAI